MSAARRSTATTDDATTGVTGGSTAGGVVIAGAGIGGLACAVALGRRGIASIILERAPSLNPVGAGIQITPNGMRVLTALGLRDRIEAVSLAARAVEPMDALSGRRIAHFPLEGAGPYRFLHRADLVATLSDAAREGGALPRVGATVIDVGRNHVVTEAGETLPATFIVGADGIHSRVRTSMGATEAAAFTGQTAWRAIVEADQPPVARIWMAQGRHVVTYPLPGGRLNVVAVQEETAWTAEGWDHPDDPANLRRAFADVAPELAAILAKVTETRRWGLFRHPIAEHWQDGSRALLGDAAHPTLPFLAQGANLALEDAWVLADLVASGRLEDYERARRARTVRAIAAANANARNYHLGGAHRVAAHLVLGAVGRLAPRLFLKRLAWLYRYDVTG